MLSAVHACSNVVLMTLILWSSLPVARLHRMLQPPIELKVSESNQASICYVYIWLISLLYITRKASSKLKAKLSPCRVMILLDGEAGRSLHLVQTMYGFLCASHCEQGAFFSSKRKIQASAFFMKNIWWWVESAHADEQPSRSMRWQLFWTTSWRRREASFRELIAACTSEVGCRFLPFFLLSNGTFH